MSSPGETLYDPALLRCTSSAGIHRLDGRWIQSSSSVPVAHKNLRQSKAPQQLQPLPGTAQIQILTRRGRVTLPAYRVALRAWPSGCGSLFLRRCYGRVRATQVWRAAASPAADAVVRAWWISSPACGACGVRLAPASLFPFPSPSSRLHIRSPHSSLTLCPATVHSLPVHTPLSGVGN
ncbi:guanine nucleotide-binding protein G(I)/G(S)/G(O) subunit gamma-12a isoform X1 [Nothobranchius furzeri]|uniref:guanine nucleotide-binding protein G(I)/G(S)/G(O) subunit gamma-12a isoform X1 n=1 Tax=Nothobranchius furzeri TaxID=105023 RepID=UPI003904918F